jgi:hypothetical protein
LNEMFLRIIGTQSNAAFEFILFFVHWEVVATKLLSWNEKITGNEIKDLKWPLNKQTLDAISCLLEILMKFLNFSLKFCANTWLRLGYKLYDVEAMRTWKVGLLNNKIYLCKYCK